MLTVRAKNIPEKLVDTYMALSCIHNKQYTPEHFIIYPNDTVIDIGGHIGSFSVYAAREAPQGKVLTFEPDPNNFALLQKNITLNNTKNISIHNIAISGSHGNLPFYHNAFNNAESGLFGNQTGPSLLVPSITLDDIFSNYTISKCDFLKIDCEGAEYDILFKASPRSLGNITRIAMECHTPAYFNLPPEYNQSRMMQFLKDAGFQTYEIKENRMHSLIFARRI